MVYTLTFICFAISAAVKGGIEPVVFEPSVSRITTLLVASLSLRRLTAVARPIPMAVPSSTIPLLMSPNKLISTSWSMVSGHCVKLSPLKITSPILSSGRFFIKSIAMFFPASSRFGFRSSASILPEISVAITISMPSVVEFCQLKADCGLARARMSAINASTLSMIP
ncbi:hypothetical protein D3C87_1685790 [compost metagenome]